MKKVLLVLFCLITVSLICENQDVINLKDGSTLIGKILEATDDFIIIKTSLGEFKVDKENIKNTPITIYLKDDNIIKGNLINRNETSIKVETTLGSFEIELERIKKIIDETDSKIISNNESSNSQNDTEMGIKAIGNAFLYQQRQKKISTALGFQALGAGLLYSEKYTMGSIMLILENGLLISGAFVEPDVAPALWISGILLKGVNTFFTIKSVNDYNNRLAAEMGLSGKKEKMIILKKGYLYIDLSTGLAFDYDYKNAIASGISLGYYLYDFGRLNFNLSASLTDSDAGFINYSLQYEKSFKIFRNQPSFCLTPKFGIGFTENSHTYKSNQGLSNYEYDVIESISVIVGTSLEYNISKLLLTKIGYDLFLGVGDSNATNSSFQITFGFKL